MDIDTALKKRTNRSGESDSTNRGRMHQFLILVASAIVFRGGDFRVRVAVNTIYITSVKGVF